MFNAAMTTGPVGDPERVIADAAEFRVYNVATPEEHRRRGYGEALTWAEIEHGRQRGCEHACLQASDLGAPIYRAMGFVDIGTYVQLEGAA